ncbi:HEPN domain-containing protein [Pseudomonas otitidis]|uniref:HEPN domain-containing protein n=1 Tax=Metapseudomonas otitidis TaxID=319939 RepID=UPI0024AD22C1|nr:HEPN domain-containing protein [Pseudomonas otitidis]MDI6528284.1 HEPN domain-containing protein [Pseudomonas otitidis]
MPSVALSRFRQQLESSEKLRNTKTDHNLNKEKQIYYQASLAATVAAWDSYIKAVTKEFIARTFSKSQESSYLIIHTSLQTQLNEKTKRLNTPNFDNARNHILEFTGYDPIIIWNYPPLNWNSIQAKVRLDEILRIRHSFAHGFPTPSLSWTTSPNGGPPRLTSEDTRFNEIFITYLAKTTDKNLEKYLFENFGITF